MKLFNLKPLYYDCKEKNIYRQAFSFQYKNKDVSVLYLTDEIPHKIYLYFKETNVQFGLNIEKGFHMDDYLGDNYKLLVKGLNLPYDAYSPLKPSHFFTELNNHIPSEAFKARIPKPHEVVSFIPLVDDKLIYFKCWRLLDRSKNTVTSENLNKIRLLIGEQAYQYCKKQNISATFTSKEYYKKSDTSFDRIEI